MSHNMSLAVGRDMSQTTNGNGGQNQAYPRPRTGAPGAARPTTSAFDSNPGRPTTRGGTMANTNMTVRFPDLQEDAIEEDDRRWAEEYESDDEDVFAFLPPDLGPAPQVIDNGDPHPYHDTSRDVGPSQALPQTYDQQQIGVPAVPDLPGPRASDVARGEEEAFYYDETTGNVYDAQGRPVRLRNAVSEATPTHANDLLATQLHRAEAPSQQLIARPPPVYPFAGTLERQQSSASYYGEDEAYPQYAAVSFSAHPLQDGVEQMRSRDGYPSAQAEGGYGLNASGSSSMIDSASMRHRSRRLSHGAGKRLSPSSELHLRMDLDGKSDSQKLARFSSDLDPYPLTADNINYMTELPQIGPKGLKIVELEMEGDEDSPHSAVRASVSNLDDPDMPVNTVRMWLLALATATVGAAINETLSLRYPAPTITSLIIQVCTYPIGKLLAAVLPIKTFRNSKCLGGQSWSLNPGIFNMKEHACIVMMANVALNNCYGINLTLAEWSSLYYNNQKPIGFDMLLVLSSQLTGFGLAGLTQKFLITPHNMIWPQVLVFTTVFNTLHAEDDGYDGSMSRFKYFYIVSISAFVWWFFPGWIFTALSSFSFLCWIWPESFTVNTLFGTTTGLGMSWLTFDWQVISYQSSPLVTPWWAQCNVFFGFVLFAWIVTPILYWTNAYDFAYLRMSSNFAYDRFGERYNVSAVLTPEFTLGESAYLGYSHLYFPTTYWIVYFTGMAALVAIIVHTALFHGKLIWRGLRGIQTEEDDVHAKLMRHYPETPKWWYGALFVAACVLAIACSEVYQTGLPVWALMLSVFIPSIYFLPSGIIYAQTGLVIGTNLISELIAGYVLPGKSLPNMMMKLYAEVGLTQGLTFSQTLKIGHYMKISPRLSFLVMLVAGIWAPIVQVSTSFFLRTHVNDLCATNQAHDFICPSVGVYFTSSIIWGVIGPDRMFGSGSHYRVLYWAFLIGALTPALFWVMARRWNNSFLKQVNVPLIFIGTNTMPPAAGIVVSSWFLVGFIFQYVMTKKNFKWWSKYNFITSAAMDTGTITCNIVIFLALVLPKDGNITLSWWGNNIVTDTLDGTPRALLSVPVDGFAPAPGAA